ncbi:MAG: hypothetical protein V3W44_00455, partial [Dehalococcoidales bacterium]
MESFVDGKYHGICKQWDDAGNLIQTYRMVHGTGIDLWRCNSTGTLSEVWYWKDNMLHGWEWWLDEDQKSVWCERHHHEGNLHGIWREWNDRGRLRRGFP